MAGSKGWRRFTREFKARVAGDAPRDVDSVAVIAARRGAHPNQVRDWLS